MGDLILSREAVLSPPGADSSLDALSVGPDHEALALWSDGAGHVAVTVQVGRELTRVVRLREFGEVRYPRVQPLPDGMILIADSRLRSGSSYNA